MSEELREKAEAYAITVEWKGDDYGARKRYYADAYLAGAQPLAEKLAKTEEKLAEGIKIMEMADCRAFDLFSEGGKCLKCDFLARTALEAIREGKGK